MAPWSSSLVARSGHPSPTICSGSGQQPCLRGAGAWIRPAVTPPAHAHAAPTRSDRPRAAHPPFFSLRRRSLRDHPLQVGVVLSSGPAKHARKPTLVRFWVSSPDSSLDFCRKLPHLSSSFTLPPVFPQPPRAAMPPPPVGLACVNRGFFVRSTCGFL
jgi:hypothetical protein